MIPAGLAETKIGYSTLRNDPTGPGDRRRFCHYAARRGLTWEPARAEGRYRIVVSSVGGDLGEWVRLPRETRLVFDMVDSWLSVPRDDLRAALRGAAKFAFRHTRRLHLDFRALIEAALRRADAVVCATEEQREAIRPYCANAHVILDFQPEAVRAVKRDYARGPVFNLVWEGLAVNLGSFRPIAGAIRTLKERHAIALHLVTDLERPRGSTYIWMQPTKDFVRPLLGADRTYLYEWNAEMLATVCAACDLAVIPIPLDNAFFAGKPENKLVLFWRMGLPVVTSATPAYVRAMRGAGPDLSCRTADDWIGAVERCILDENLRREAGERGLAYASRAVDEDGLLSRWDAVFESVLH